MLTEAGTPENAIRVDAGGPTHGNHIDEWPADTSRADPEECSHMIPNVSHLFHHQQAYHRLSYYFLVRLSNDVGIKVEFEVGDVCCWNVFCCAVKRALGLSGWNAECGSIKE